jgi:hypothetical protein
MAEETVCQGSKCAALEKRTRKAFNPIKYWRIIFPILLTCILVSIIIIVIYYPATMDLFTIQRITHNGILPAVSQQTAAAINTAARSITK